eukprot:GGOE01008865.1.p1 GENE.GGOE01008865.1~~GGOE01008865.1.p1  ORF type:complete len:617 (-),score=119.64 GGOE01008865.1:1382-3202(-)
MTTAKNPIGEALKCVGLPGFEKDLRTRLGCKSFEALLQLSDADLQRIGMKQTQRRKLLTWSSLLRQYVQRGAVREGSFESPDEVGGILSPRPVYSVEPPQSLQGAAQLAPSTFEPKPQSPSHSLVQTTSSPELAKVRLCTSYGKKGACHFGSQCKFAHDKNELRIDPRDGLFHDKFVQFERVIKELSVQPLHSCVVFGDYLSVDQHQAVYAAAKKFQLRTRSFGQNADRCVVVCKGELSGETHPCLRVYGTCAYGQQCTWSSFPRELCLRCLKDRSHSEHQCDNTCDLEALMHSTKDAVELCHRVEEFLRRTQERSQTIDNNSPGEVLAFKMALSGQQRKVVFWKAKMLGLTPLVCGSPPHCAVVVLAEQNVDLPAHPCHRVYGKCNFKKCIFEPFPRMACLRCLKGKTHDMCDTQRELSPQHAVFLPSDGYSMTSPRFATANPWCFFQQPLPSPPAQSLVPTLHLPEVGLHVQEQVQSPQGMAYAPGLSGFNFDDKYFDPSMDIAASLDIAELLGDAEQEMSQLLQPAAQEVEVAPPQAPVNAEEFVGQCWEQYTSNWGDGEPGAPHKAREGASEDTSSCDELLDGLLGTRSTVRTADRPHQTTA